MLISPMRGRGDCPDLQVGVAPDVVASLVFLVADDDAAVGDFANILRGM